MPGHFSLYNSLRAPMAGTGRQLQPHRQAVAVQRRFFIILWTNTK